MVYCSLIGGIVGARLGYAMRFLDVYLNEPLSFFSLNPNTLAPLEGGVAALIVALIYGQRRGLPLWPSLDALTPGLALFSVFIGLTHLSNGDAFGAPTSMPWAIELWGAQRHPSQVYEILAALLILLAVQRLKFRSHISGFVFVSWMAMTALSRLLLEAFRGDSVIVLGGVRSAQLISLAIILASMLTLHLLVSKREG